MTEKPEDPERRAERPAGCWADVSKTFATCERCAIAWDPSREDLACSPVTAARLRAIIARTLCRLEASREAVEQIAKDDPRTGDPLPAIRLETEMRSVSRFVERVLSDKAILEILRRAPK